MAERLKLLGFGPDGLIANFFGAMAEDLGHDYVLKTTSAAAALPTEAELVAADVVVLWCGPHAMTLREADAMHEVLVTLQALDPLTTTTTTTKRRVVLVSNLLSWAATPGLGAAFREETTTKKKRLTEDDYLKRRGGAASEREMILEAHVMRLRGGPSLDTVVVGAGLVFGAGEAALAALVAGALSGARPLKLPCAGDSCAPTVHVGDLFAFVFALLDAGAFPKPYVLAASDDFPRIADVAAAILDSADASASDGAYETPPAVASNNSTGDGAEGAPAASSASSNKNPAVPTPSETTPDGEPPAPEDAPEPQSEPKMMTTKAPFELRHDLKYEAAAAAAAADDDENENEAPPLPSCGDAMLRLDLSGLTTAGSVFEATMMGGSAEPFGPLLRSAGAVVEEFVLCRCLRPVKVWVVRPADDDLKGAAALIGGDLLKVPVLTVASCVAWARGQAPKPKFVAPGQEPKSPEELAAEEKAAKKNSSNNRGGGGKKKADKDEAPPEEAKVEVPLSPEDEARKKAVDFAVATASQHQRKVWSLRADLAVVATEGDVPPALAARCVRLRLLAPDVVHRGYVLDGAPATAAQLEAIFVDKNNTKATVAAPTADGAPPPPPPPQDDAPPAVEAVRCAPALMPTHVCVLSAASAAQSSSSSVSPSPPPGDSTKPRFQDFASILDKDWRYGARAPPAGGGGALGLVDSLREILKLEPVVLDAGEVADEEVQRRSKAAEDAAPTEGGGGGEEKNASSQAPPEKKNNEDPAAVAATADDNEALRPLTWREEVEGRFATRLLQEDAFGTWDVALVDPPKDAAVFEDDAMDAPAPAPTPAPAGALPEEAPPPPPPPQEDAPPAPEAYRGQFDAVPKAEFDELFERSAQPRTYLMDNVMVQLTRAMLGIVRLPEGTDKIAALADHLDIAAKVEEDRAEAEALRRFQESLAKFKDLRALEIDEDMREAEEQAARERGDVV